MLKKPLVKQILFIGFATASLTVTYLLDVYDLKVAWRNPTAIRQMLRRPFYNNEDSVTSAVSIKGHIIEGEVGHVVCGSISKHQADYRGTANTTKADEVVSGGMLNPLIGMVSRP